MGSKPSGISGSRSAAVLGLSEFTSQFEVFQQIKEERFPGWNASKGYHIPVFEGNASTRWGLAFEEPIKLLTAQATKKSIGDEEQHFERGYLTAHVDGLFFKRHGGGLYEGKSTSPFPYQRKWGEPGTDHIPQTYAAQIQHNLILSGEQEATLGLLVFPEAPDRFEELGWQALETSKGRFKLVNQARNLTSAPEVWAEVFAEIGFFHLYTIKANPQTQALMIEKYREFWERYILGDEEPHPTTDEDIKRAFPEPVGSIVVTDQVQAWIEERKAISEEIGGRGPLSKRKDELKLLVLDWARKQETVIDEASREKTLLLGQDGKKLASWDGKTFR